MRGGGERADQTPEVLTWIIDGTKFSDYSFGTPGMELSQICTGMLGQRVFKQTLFDGKI